MKWSEQTIASCTELWTPGKIWSSQISSILTAELGHEVTFYVVIARMNRCGLSHSGPLTNAPRVPGTSSKRRSEMSSDQLDDLRSYEPDRDHRNRAERRARYGLPPAASARKPVAPKPPAPVSAPSDVGLPPSFQIPLLDLREHHCRYVADDPVHDALVWAHGQFSTWAALADRIVTDRD